MNKFRFTLWSVPIVLITIIGLWNNSSVGAAQTAHSSAAVSGQIQWETNTQVTFDPIEKEGPIMRVSPDGETLLIAYNVVRQGQEDKFDVMYAESGDQGATWDTFTIHSEAATAGTISSQVDLEYDASGTAHAVWVYGSALAYGRYDDWGAATPYKLHDPAPPNFVLYPNLATSGDETVDVVWSASSAIKHVRSEDGGDSWSGIGNISPVYALKTSIDIEAEADTLHVVWEEINETNLVSGTIKYVQGDVTVSPVVWSTPIIVSSVISPTIHDAHEATVVINDGELQVAYTHRQAKEMQWVYVTTCNLNLDCTQIDNWVLDSTPISGAMLGVNAEAPWNVLSDFISYNGCVYAHFHGTTADYAEDNELIWGTNSCSNWAASGREALTNPQMQALFPSATVNGSRVYLAYGQNPVIDDPYHQIFFRRGSPSGRNVYLPIVVK